jgi:hypothetical protein
VLLEPRNQVPLRSGSGFPETQNDSFTSSRFMCISDTNDPSYVNIVAVATPPNSTITSIKSKDCNCLHNLFHHSNQILENEQDWTSIKLLRGDVSICGSTVAYCCNTIFNTKTGNIRIIASTCGVGIRMGNFII